MGYRRMDLPTLKSIVRRYVAHQSQVEISLQEGFDRKTVRQYLNIIHHHGIRPGEPIPDDEALQKILGDCLPKNTRVRYKRVELEPFRGEINILLGYEPDAEGVRHKPVKAKTAYLIIRDKYQLSVSYETFKLYLREIRPAGSRKPACVRLEVEPGQEAQADYFSVGLFTDPRTGKRRKTYGFIGKLSCSRFPFLEFCHTQDSRQFVETNIRMMDFFRAVPVRVVIDNLKAGVIKPDIYDPRLNTAYRDFAEHYGTFIDPARVATPTDKAKVERIVQQAREVFRYLVHVHPTYSLAEINRAALVWCFEDYGMKVHGTTGLQPAIVWQQEELPRMLPLPAQPFEVPVYKYATVHQDRFLEFERKRYAMPEGYRGVRVLLRKSNEMLRIFGDRHQLVREYAISEARVNYLPGDFSEHQEALMQGSYPQYLIRQARAIGPEVEILVNQILTPHAWIKARAAKGVIEILKEHQYEENFSSVCMLAVSSRIYLPKQLKSMFDQMQDQQKFGFMFPQSETGKRMTRRVGEYFSEGDGHGNDAAFGYKFEEAPDAGSSRQSGT